MKIAIYIESLRTFTSGMPHRGVLIELISLRKNDDFILILRKGILEPHMQELFQALKPFLNWKLVYEKKSHKTVNFLALLHYKDHAKVNIKADIYLSFDAEYLGTNNSPQIITLHDLSSVRNTNSSSISYIKKFARKYTIQNGVKHADIIVSISEFTKNDIIDYFNIKERKIITIYNGIDPKWFENNTQETEEFISENYWIWWGAFSKRKNLTRLLQAYDQLLQKNLNNSQKIPMLYLIGNHNNYSQTLISQVQNSQLLTQKVKFLPQKEFTELKTLVKNSKGLLFPSMYEGFGLPVIEAYSQGKPVLTSKVSSLPEIAGEHGILVDPYSIKSIKDGLELFYKEKISETKELKLYAKKYTYKNAANQYSKLIDKCL